MHWLRQRNVSYSNRYGLSVGRFFIRFDGHGYLTAWTPGVGKLVNYSIPFDGHMPALMAKLNKMHLHIYKTSIYGASIQCRYKVLPRTLRNVS